MEKNQFENYQKKLEKPPTHVNPIKPGIQPSELKINFRFETKQKCNSISNIIEVFQETHFE